MEALALFISTGSLVFAMGVLAQSLHTWRPETIGLALGAVLISMLAMVLVVTP